MFWLYNFFYIRLLKKGSNIKEHYGYGFNTFTFISFNWIYDMFYHKEKKRISPKIENYFTPLALAVWIMDDGGWVKPGVRISTYSFKLEEVKFLVLLLKKLYNLDCTIQTLKNGTQSSIYIKKESIFKLTNLILLYMHNYMHYKLGINV